MSCLVNHLEKKTLQKICKHIDETWNFDRMDMSDHKITKKRNQIHFHYNRWFVKITEVHATEKNNSGQ